jgi:hypothetical protein
MGFGGTSHYYREYQSVTHSLTLLYDENGDYLLPLLLHYFKHNFLIFFF